MIYAVVGDVGTGKTLLMTHLALLMHRLGIIVYANYHLKFKYIEIKSIEQLFNVSINKQNLFLLDEAWITADARKASSFSNINFSKFLLQARKKRGNVIFTVQDISQIDKRIRINTSYIIRPSIVSVIEENGKEVPCVMKADFYDRSFRLSHSKLFVVYPSHNFYDTLEIVEESHSIRYDKLIEKYSNFTGTKSGLSSCLHYEDGLTKADANHFSNYIWAKRINEYKQEIKDANGDINILKK